ncbi:hypothetical protein GBA52_028501 [Prunus armeniaca]|nr:hypothetical protein GBA52_028501 [Prunus armeniaca]
MVATRRARSMGTKRGDMKSVDLGEQATKHHTQAIYQVVSLQAQIQVLDPRKGCWSKTNYSNLVANQVNFWDRGHLGLRFDGRRDTDRWSCGEVRGKEMKEK